MDGLSSLLVDAAVNGFTTLFAPTIEQQTSSFGNTGINCALEVEFDVPMIVDDSSMLSSVLWDEDSNRFFHFFRGFSTEDSGDQRIPLRIIFVVDVSGSMSGDKMVQAKNAFAAVLATVDKDDTFGLMKFEDSSKMLTQLAKATTDKRKEAIAKAQGLESGGGTNIQDAVLLALDKLLDYNDGVDEGVYQNTIVILTDGQSSVNINDVVAKNQQRTNIFTLGFGSGVDRNLLTELASANGGFYQEVYVASDADKQLTDFYTRISSPILADVQISYDPAPIGEKLSRVNFRSLNSGGEVMVCGELAKPPVLGELSVTVNAKAVTGQKEISTKVALADSQTDSLRGFAARACAMLLIEQDQETAGLITTNKDGADKARAYAIELALKHRLVVDGMTALVVVATEKKHNDTNKTDANGTSIGGGNNGNGGDGNTRAGGVPSVNRKGPGGGMSDGPAMAMHDRGGASTIACSFISIMVLWAGILELLNLL